MAANPRRGNARNGCAPRAHASCCLRGAFWVWCRPHGGSDQACAEREGQARVLVLAGSRDAVGTRKALSLTGCCWACASRTREESRAGEVAEATWEVKANASAWSPADTLAQSGHNPWWRLAAVEGASHGGRNPEELVSGKVRHSPDEKSARHGPRNLFPNQGWDEGELEEGNGHSGDPGDTGALRRAQMQVVVQRH